MQVSGYTFPRGPLHCLGELFASMCAFLAAIAHRLVVVMQGSILTLSLRPQRGPASTLVLLADDMRPRYPSRTIVTM